MRKNNVTTILKKYRKMSFFYFELVRVFVRGVMRKLYKRVHRKLKNYASFATVVFLMTKKIQS